MIAIFLSGILFVIIFFGLLAILHTNSPDSDIAILNVLLGFWAIAATLMFALTLSDYS